MNANPLKEFGVLTRSAVLIGLISGMAVASVSAADSSENRGQLSAADYKFASAAARGGDMEVTLGKLAAQKSSEPAVQQFGQRMVQDHGKAGTDLVAIASRKGAILSTLPSAEQQRHIDHLSSLSGREFDKAYVAMMVRDHKADLKEFKHAAENAQDPDLRSFAANTVPMIQEHLKVAEDLEQSLKAKFSASK